MTGFFFRVTGGLLIFLLLGWVSELPSRVAKHILRIALQSFQVGLPNIYRVYIGCVIFHFQFAFQSCHIRVAILLTFQILIKDNKVAWFSCWKLSFRVANQGCQTIVVQLENNCRPIGEQRRPIGEQRRPIEEQRRPIGEHLSNWRSISQLEIN